jgi:hypothetical protein
MVDENNLINFYKFELKTKNLGSCGYSIVEIDTFKRHNVNFIKAHFGFKKLELIKYF